MSTLLLSEARGLCALTIFFTVVREYSRTISKIWRQIQAPRLLIYTTRDPLLWCHQISSVIANTLVRWHQRPSVTSSQCQHKRPRNSHLLVDTQKSSIDVIFQSEDLQAWSFSPVWPPFAVMDFTELLKETWREGNAFAYPSRHNLEDIHLRNYFFHCQSTLSYWL
jgi:hypothetical protein